MSDLLEIVLELILDLFDLFRWWRCGLCLAASVAVLSLLQWLLPGSRAAFWISVASVGISLALGLVWEWRVTDDQSCWS